MNKRTYIAIDLKSFYASVECVDRGLDPLNTNLVVADKTRTEKTICLAVTPALKSYGVAGRARLFEVIQKVKEINRGRRRNAKDRKFTGKSYLDSELKADPSLELDYIVAPPRMAHYIDYSTKIYQIYLQYAAPDDIHVYSIDEVFIDVISYLNTAKCTAREYAMRMIKHVLKETGITATAGIGTNMYLCKVAMDIVAKHVPADKDGVRIAELDEMTYRKTLWSHRPLTDFWRIGNGYSDKLEQCGLFTMGDIARCSIENGAIYNEGLLYRLFGINAELLIDHAWGWEPCTIAAVKSYKPQSNSISSGQVLQEPYPYEKAKLVLSEMADALALDLVAKGLVTNQIVITVGYDCDNKNYTGEYSIDHYGRKIPKHAHGTYNFKMRTSSCKYIGLAANELFDRIVNKKLNIRRLNITAAKVVYEREVSEPELEQLDLFTDYEQLFAERKTQKEESEREKKRQKAVLAIREKYGKNAILKANSLEDGATARSRNEQIGGHKA